MFLHIYQVKVDDKSFVEAYAGKFGIFTRADQMISVLIDDKKIVFNSSGNVDTFAKQGFSCGQNNRNKRQFADTFELLAMEQSSKHFIGNMYG